MSATVAFGGVMSDMIQFVTLSGLGDRFGCRLTVLDSSSGIKNVGDDN